MPIAEKPTTVDQYIAQFDASIATLMQTVRHLIHEAHDEIGEKISWGMPTFTLYGNMVHFAGHKHHLGFYPGPSAVAAFAEVLVDYTTSKGAIRFPYDQPLPQGLIKDIIAFRVAEQLQKKAKKPS